MSTHLIYLDKNSNPEFYNLVEEFNLLMDRWNICNDKVHKFRIPRVTLYFTKRNLLKIGEECHLLQKDYIDWNKRASNFALHPNYKFDSTQNGELVYTHFTNNMKHTLNEMRDCMTLLTENYNKRYIEYENQINFDIAITAFVIGLIGLGLSIFSILTHENIRTELNKTQLPQKIASIEEQLNQLKTKIDSFSNGLITNNFQKILATQSEILMKVSKKDSTK